MKAFPLLLILTACTPHLVSSNEAGGIINMTGSVNGQKQSMVQADTECHKYGKVALSKGVNLLNNTMRYECVKP